MHKTKGLHSPHLVYKRLRPTVTVMSDDGTGRSLDIPTFLISGVYGEVLRRALAVEGMRGIVSLTLTFEEPKGRGK
jgi:hypothetical protein